MCVYKTVHIQEINIKGDINPFSECTASFTAF